MPRKDIHKDGKHTQFKKGQSGNPKGRTKGSLNRATIVKKWLEAARKQENILTGEIEFLTEEDCITLAAIAKARLGDVQAYKALMDSAYGQAKQEIKQQTETQIIWKETKTYGPDSETDDGA